MAIIYSYPEKTSPVGADLLLMSDSADNNRTVQAKISSIKDTLDVVDSIVAGSGIGVSAATGNVIVSNTGVLTVGTTDGTFVNLTPNAPAAGAVTVTADLSATGTPSASNFLRGDNTWATPSASGLTFDGTTVGGVLSYKNANEITTSSTVLISANTVTVGDTMGIAAVSSQLRVGDLTGGSYPVCLYADGSEVLKIDDSGAYHIGGGTGTSGQYLKSTGSGSSPVWSSLGFLDPTNTTTPSIQISGANDTDANSGGSGQAFANTQGVLNLQGLSSTANSTVMAISGEDNVGTSTGNLVNCFMASHLGPGYTLIGRIQADRNTNTLSFNNTSDYRLKENVSSMSGSLAKVTALNPVNYNVIDIYTNPNPVLAEGFLAHELQEQIPNAVTGVKDAVNEDGSIKAQTVDLVRIIPYLVGAIKELTARIEALEA